jgi:hypothetical protein
MSDTFPAKLTTPVEIQIPVIGVMDHGLALVHSIGGKPRNYLHEVSALRNHESAIGYLTDAGYAYRCGWVAKDGIKFNTYSKAFPLSVVTWCV